RLGRLRAGGADPDAAAGTGGQHHQAHDGCPADGHAVLLDFHHGLELAGELDELGRCAGMKPALVDDRELAHDRLLAGGIGSHLAVRTWLATLIYLRPAVCASSSATCMSSLRRTLVSVV